MGDPTLFPVRAARFTRQVGPENAIRISHSRRAFISVLFWFVLLLGVGSLIVMHDLGGLASFGISVVFALLMAVWGQYWRDVENAARSVAHAPPVRQSDWEQEETPEETVYLKCTFLFGYALRRRRTNPPRAAPTPVDLTDPAARARIREALVELIDKHRLKGRPPREIAETLSPHLTIQTDAVVDAAYETAFGLTTVETLSEMSPADFPRHGRMQEHFDDLAKIACPGTAQLIGDTLPQEVRDTWPRFSTTFDTVKAARSHLWPDV